MSTSPPPPDRSLSAPSAGAQKVPVAPSSQDTEVSHNADEQRDAATPIDLSKQREIGGREGPEPTRFGDWEKNGRCFDF